MKPEKLNRAELEIARLLVAGRHTVSELARARGISLPWATLCVRHLERLGIVRTVKTGRSVVVDIGGSPAARDLALLIRESPHIDIMKVLPDSGLLVLPWLIEPGATMGELEMRTLLCRRTVADRLRLARGMGLVVLGEDAYHLNGAHMHLGRFLASFCEASNGTTLRTAHPEGVMVWQHRLEFVFSLDGPASGGTFLEAGLTRLDRLGLDLVHEREYYMHSPGITAVTEAEAFAQALAADPLNPRIVRLVRDELSRGKVDVKDVAGFAAKYGVRELLEVG